MNPIGTQLVWTLYVSENNTIHKHIISEKKMCGAPLSSMVYFYRDWLQLRCNPDVLSLCNSWKCKIRLMHFVGNILLEQWEGKSFLFAWYESAVAIMLHAIVTAVFIEIVINLTRMLVGVPSCIRRIEVVSIWFSFYVGDLHFHGDTRQWLIYGRNLSPKKRYDFASVFGCM